MVDGSDDQLELLRQIRDLLMPIASHYRPEYEERQAQERRAKAEQLPQVVRGKQARAACLLMDGTNDQAAIRRNTSIGSGNLSVMVSRLEDQGMLEGTDRRKPKVIFSREELRKLFGGTP